MGGSEGDRLPVWRRGLITVLGFGVAVFGLANVMPAYGGVRIGPFPLELFRAAFFSICILTAAVLVDPMDRAAPDSARARWRFAFGLVLAAVGVWACWQYYWVAIELDDAMTLFGRNDALIAIAASVVALYFCWRFWGVPVALLGVIGILYLTTGDYWPGFLRTQSTGVWEVLAQNLWFSTDSGILGSTFGIVLTTVMPFIILGAVLEGVGAGESMIRISFSMMRHTAGGPAHAAVLASGLFGTVSGSAVANVVGTGVVTIPMIRRRGFSANFAGAVEAAASSGGQIMPPIMGAAAIVMADYVGVSYLTVIMAVLVPALAYYLSLFVMVMFEARRLKIRPELQDDPAQRPTAQDWLNLIMVFGPLALIVMLLIKGMSPAGASISALLLLFPLSLVNPVIRAQPIRLLGALRDGGITFAQLAMAIAAVSVVISVLAATGVPVKFSVMLANLSSSSLFVALSLAALGCIVLGMGMPTLPAYVTVVVVMAPTLQALGLAPLTAHMFVFMFAVASAITPPVAIAAYAAAAISAGRPIGTAVQATRIGIMIFIIPFAFAYNPLILTVEQAGATFTWGPWLLLMVKLVFAIYVLGSALIGFERTRLAPLDIGLRIVAAILMFAPGQWSDLVGVALAAVLLVLHHRGRAADSPPDDAASIKPGIS